MPQAMDMQAWRLIKNMDKISTPMFLLIQDNVLGVSKVPMRLPFQDLDLTRKWQVVIGTVNEFGNQEIVGLAAEVYPKIDTTCWRISSPIDGDFRLIGTTGAMSDLIYKRLEVLFCKGQYDDVCNLPMPITLYSCNSR